MKVPAMSRGYLVLDIETVPDPELYTPPDQPSGTEKPFPPLYAHRPIVIGVLWLDELFGFKRIGVIGEHDDEPAHARRTSRRSSSSGGRTS